MIEDIILASKLNLIILVECKSETKNKIMKIGEVFLNLSITTKQIRSICSSKIALLQVFFKYSSIGLNMIHCLRLTRARVVGRCTSHLEGTPMSFNPFTFFCIKFA